MKTLAIGRMSAIMIPIGLALILGGFLIAEMVVRAFLLLLGLVVLGYALSGFSRVVNGCQKMIEEV